MGRHRYIIYQFNRDPNGSGIEANYRDTVECYRLRFNMLLVLFHYVARLSLDS